MAPVMGTEQRQEFFNFEAGAAARKLVELLAQVQPGQEVVVTADSQSDARCVDLAAREVFTAGGVPVIAWYSMRPYPCLDPPRSVTRAVVGSDVWIDFSVSYALYSEAYREAISNGCRYVCLTGMTVDMLVRMIGRVDFGRLQEFAAVLRDLTAKADAVRLTSPAGTDLAARMSKEPMRTIARPPGASVMLIGQVPWRLAEDSINGMLVFDGALWPPAELGALRSPIGMRVTDGCIHDIDGGREAAVFARWLASFRHRAMHRISHCTFGCNPGATKITGSTLEDERVFGCVEFGIGAARQGAPSHADGIVLHPTVWLDGVPIEEDGIYVHPDLERLARELQAVGYPNGVE